MVSGKGKQLLLDDAHGKLTTVMEVFIYISVCIYVNTYVDIC
jgi:hypothetical protein